MESDRKVEAVVRVCERDEMFLIEERERERDVNNMDLTK
jgi:hypothetical protein